MEAITAIHNVEVAAPLAIVGLANWPSTMQVKLGYPSSPVAVYRVQASELADADLSLYALETRYIVIARNGVLHVLGNDVTLTVGAAQLKCPYPITCFAPTSCLGTDCSAQRTEDDPAYVSYILQPVVIAGIDPVAEARLVGLDGCVRQGRYLTTSDAPTDLGTRDDLEQIPVLAASDSFIDEKFVARVARATNSEAVLTGTNPMILSFGPSTATTETASKLYQAFLATMRAPDNGTADPYGLWSVGDVAYDWSGQTLQPKPRSASPDILLPTGTMGIGDAPARVLVPPEAADTWFRNVTAHPDAYVPGPGSSYRFKQWHVLGVYEPQCLRGFATIAGGNLEAYSAPQATLPNGAQLMPNRSVAGYLNSPPLILTTLAGAAWLTDPKRYTGQSGAAPISIVRVKVSGTASPGTASENRLRQVAAAIAERTGLIVDIVKGASTQPVDVNLPAGQHGRPALLVTEGWFKKGVAIRFYLAVSSQSLLVFSVLLVVAGLMVAAGAFTAVRRRRSEFALLRATGWSAWRIGWLVEIEVLVLGAAAASIAILATVAATKLVASQAGLGEALLIPFMAASAVAVIAGALPAWTASRGTVVSRLRPPIHPARPTVLRGGLISLAFLLLRGRRTETALGAIACALSASLAAILVTLSSTFQSELDSTRLGLNLSLEVDRFQAIASVEAAILTIASVGLTSVLTSLELRKQLAVLRAIGWSNLKIAALASFQGLVIALAGSGLGVAMLTLVALGLGIPLTKLSEAVPTLVTLGALTLLVAVVASSWLSLSGRPARVLRS